MKVDNNLQIEEGKWSFGGNVMEYFDEHILKSIPLYKESHDLVISYSDYFVKKGSVIYDIGCSTGTLIQEIAKRHKNINNVKYYGVDSVNNMILYAKDKNKYKNVSYLNEDIIKYNLKKSSIICVMYSLQFINPKHRQDIVDKFYKSLDWGGVLFMFEKIRGNDARFQDIMTGTYDTFKLNNGFSHEQIINKSISLKGILEPFSNKGNIELMNRAGFIDIQTIFCFNCFKGWCAIK